MGDLFPRYPAHQGVGKPHTLADDRIEQSRESVPEIAEEEPAAEKERLAVTLRSIGDAVIATDVVGKVSSINSQLSSRVP